MIRWGEEHKVHLYDALEFIDSGHDEEPYKEYGEGKIMNPPCVGVPREIEKNGEWYPDHYWIYADDLEMLDVGVETGVAAQVPIFTPIPLCMKAKAIGESVKDKIIHVQISPEATVPGILMQREGNFNRYVDYSGISHIPHSEYGTFWYHKKCRCFMCDKVRYTAYKKLAWNLPEADKKRVEGKFWEIGGTLKKGDDRGIHRWCSMDYALNTDKCRLSLPVFWQYIRKWDEKDGCPPSEERREWEIADRYK